MGPTCSPVAAYAATDSLRTKVTDLLTTGASYAMVLRALGDDNATLEKGDQVTIDSIRNHAARHFPVQQVARATYREILERRATENSVDFIEGVATAITPMAFLETVMVKGYQSLVDENATVSLRDAMEAALKLNEIARKDEGAMDRARILADMGRIIEVVRTFIPSERVARRTGGPARRKPCLPADFARGGRGAHGGHRRHPG